MGAKERRPVEPQQESRETGPDDLPPIRQVKLQNAVALGTDWKPVSKNETDHLLGQVSSNPTETSAEAPLWNALNLILVGQWPAAAACHSPAKS